MVSQQENWEHKLPEQIRVQCPQLIGVLGKAVMRADGHAGHIRQPVRHALVAVDAGFLTGGQHCGVHGAGAR